MVPGDRPASFTRSAGSTPQRRWPRSPGSWFRANFWLAATSAPVVGARLGSSDRVCGGFSNVRVGGGSHTRQAMESSPAARRGARVDRGRAVLRRTPSHLFSHAGHVGVDGSCVWAIVSGRRCCGVVHRWNDHPDSHGRTVAHSGLRGTVCPVLKARPGISAFQTEAESRLTNRNQLQ